MGRLRAELGDKSITHFRTQKAAALLACLAFRLGQAVTRDELMEIIWPDTAPKEGRDRLNVELSGLRKQFEPPELPRGAVLIGDRFKVSLNPEVVSTDVALFESAWRKALRTANGPEKVRLLMEAVELYQGPLLHDFDHIWVEPARERLAKMFFEANDQLVLLLAQTPEAERAVEFARRALGFDRLREEAHCTLIRSLLKTGQARAALRQYRELERILADELGDIPSEAASRLAEEAIQQCKTPHPASTRSIPPATRNAAQTVPVGAVAFLVTDIEGSTALARRLGDGYNEVLERHHAVLRREFRRHAGYEFKEMGDGFWVAFAKANDALACAVSSQRALAAEAWPEPSVRPEVRMALHLGDVEHREGDYRGIALHDASRLLAVARGGQILLSSAMEAVVRRDLAPGLRLTDLGIFLLRDVPAPEHLFQVEYPDMPRCDFGTPNGIRVLTPKLPSTFTRFLGRGEERRRLEQMLLEQETRLVTLTGMGGSGKTRLAVETARALTDRFHGAVHYVPLADLSDPRLLAGHMLRALNQEPASDRDTWDLVDEALARQPSLLVLDNFDEIVEECAPDIGALLERTPTLTCLVTVT